MYIKLIIISFILLFSSCNKLQKWNYEFWKSEYVYRQNHKHIKVPQKPCGHYYFNKYCQICKSYR